MKPNSLLSERLNGLRAKIRQGEPARALQSLNMLFVEEGNSLASVSVLAVMAEAAVALDDEEGTRRLIRRALELFEQALPGAVQGCSEALLDLAEVLAASGRPEEALALAEKALEKVVVLEMGSRDDDSLAEFLGRYAEIAGRAGAAELAREAYTYALLLAHVATGVHFEIAPALLALTEQINRDVPSAVMHRVARLITDSLGSA